MNLGAMMKQAQAMQAKMTELQERAASQEFTGSSGNGLVTITMTGKGEARTVAIDATLCNADDKEMLEDLLVAAINDARQKADAEMGAETQKLMGGLSLPPGLKLPF